MENLIRKFTITIESNEDGQTIHRVNEGISHHELIGICHVIIHENTIRMISKSELEIIEKEVN